MPSTALPPRSGPTRVTRTYAVWSRNATSIAPPMGKIAGGRPLANVVLAPVFGSTRVIRPTAPSATYSAPSGPTVLPLVPSRPEASRVAWGPRDVGGALAADGVIVAIRTAAHNNTFRSDLIGLSGFGLRSNEEAIPGA